MHDVAWCSAMCVDTSSSDAHRWSHSGQKKASLSRVGNDASGIAFKRPVAAFGTTPVPDNDADELLLVVPVLSPLTTVAVAASSSSLRGFCWDALPLLLLELDSDLLLLELLCEAD